MVYLDNRTRNASDVIAAFTDDMRRRGLIPPNDLIGEADRRRCRVQGMHGSKRASVPS